MQQWWWRDIGASSAGASIDATAHITFYHFITMSFDVGVRVGVGVVVGGDGGGDDGLVAAIITT